VSTFLYIIVLLLWNVAGGLVGYFIGRGKGRTTSGFLFGFFLGWIGWIIVALLHATPEAEAAHILALGQALKDGQHPTPLIPGRPGGELPLLAVNDLRVSFVKGKQTVQAVAGISFGIYQGETLGLVGESGCGKSTTGRAIVQVEKPTSGNITFGDVDLTSLDRSDLRTLRTKVQMIFQDPISSLNPRRRVAEIVAEPLTIWKIDNKQKRKDTAYAMLETVGIDPTVSGDRYPREFSGGQCQRISIARALVLKPQLLVCDEIVSALDVSVQAQILNLLEDLKRTYNLTILFIAHDLAVVKNVSDRVAVMYLGRLCEIAPSDVLYQAPAHHYTEALLSAAVEPDPDATRTQVVLAGEPPSPINPPSGCRFRTRCPRAENRCAEEVPELREIAPGHQVACHFPLVGF
jgi:peptide/nickel transport system ATP-binding protein